jgi:hypothetical protein
MLFLVHRAGHNYANVIIANLTINWRNLPVRHVDVGDRPQHDQRYLRTPAREFGQGAVPCSREASPAETRVDSERQNDTLPRT